MLYLCDMETETLTLDEQIEDLRIETLAKIGQILSNSTLTSSTKILQIRKLTAHNENAIRAIV